MENISGDYMSNLIERRTEDRLNNIDCLDENLKKIKNSLIVDISPGGAGLLIRKKLEGISGNICLNILQADLSSLRGFKIQADVAWVDEEYDSYYRKIGVKFINTDEELKKHISQAIDWFGNRDHHFLRCEVTYD